MTNTALRAKAQPAPVQSTNNTHMVFEGEHFEQIYNIKRGNIRTPCPKEG